MEHYNPFSPAYSPSYASNPQNPSSWDDTPDPSGRSISADLAGLADLDNAAADFFEAFAEANEFIDSLPHGSSRRLRLPSPRPRTPSPLSLTRSASRLQQQEPIHIPPLLSSHFVSSSPDLDYLFEHDPVNQMPQTATTSQNTRESSVVDLTEPSPSNNTNINTMPPRKRKADTPEDGRASKATRTDLSKTSRQMKAEGLEMVDLVDIDDDEKYEDFKAKQRAELIKQQQLEEATKPAKLAEFQCIICMDNPTDLTVTHCGHLFCSECLHQALYAGNAKKCCPVCRTAISTTLQGKDKKQPKNGVFVLEMKLTMAKRRMQPA